VGALVALLVVPAWLPALASSIAGPDPKFYWYLSRASALVAYVLLWVSMASGLLISNKMARVWPGAFTAFDLHQFTSLLGLAFALFHALILLGERYIGYSLVEILVPFAGAEYRPLWVGIGQVSFYVSVVVSFTFYVRRQIGTKAWRLIHFLSYGTFGMAILHGVLSGTDSGNPWLAWMYWLSALSLVALSAYRVAITQRKPAQRASLIKT
jgi:predicted ferric reductase